MFENRGSEPSWKLREKLRDRNAEGDSMNAIKSLRTRPFAAAGRSHYSVWGQIADGNAWPGERTGSFQKNREASSF